MPMDDKVLPAVEPADEPLAPPQVINPQPQRPAPSQALQLVTLAETVELFHSPAGEAYATVEVNDHWETWPLRSRGFRHWLAYQYFRRERKIPGPQVLQGAMGILEGEALFNGPEQAVFIRLAQHEDAIYLDLTNAMWEVIEVTATGWRVLQRSPVMFLRRRGMLPLPCPKAGGSLADLRQFVNVGSDVDWRIVVAWLMAALRPCGPFPVLTLHGEQGAAKSTLARTSAPWSTPVRPRCAPNRGGSVT
jgi:hypothetical protein